jgi:hypothetical protein
LTASAWSSHSVTPPKNDPLLKATVNTPSGPHTFPTRDGEPVILDPFQSRNALKAGLPEVDVATRRLRLERLIGLDETRGVRGDLARARRAKELGHVYWVDGETVDQAIAGYERALAHADIAFVALEFGTWGPPHGEHALRDDAWLWRHGDPQGPEAAAIRQRLQDFFYPPRDDWKEMVLWRSRQVFRQALEGLAGGQAR